MNEPTLLHHLGLESWLNFMEVDALIGAFIGASIFTAKTTHISWVMKILGLFISASCGYFFAIEAKDFVNEIIGKFFNFQFKRLDILACIIAIISVPLLSGLVEWANNFNVKQAIDNNLDNFVKKQKSKKDHADDE